MAPLNPPEQPRDASCRFVEIDGASLTLNYIREYALKLLGKPQTISTRMCQQETRWHTIISGVEFLIGDDASQKDKWRHGATCNSGTSAEALANYFLHLWDAREIRSGKKKYQWDDGKMQFVEIPQL